MKSSKRMIAQVVALVVSSMGATMAMAAGTPALLGGGSSLVAPSIGSEISIFPSADGSLTYFSVGSGAGQSAFLTNTPTVLNPTATGTVDFANSDAALSATQISNYQAGLGKTNGPLVQIPYIVTPITIPVVNGPVGTGPTLPGSTTATVALNDADLCGIFSGQTTTWDKVTNPDTSASYSATGLSSIKVVYRTDGSGTSDLLTRHLAAVCSSTTNVTFAETQTFAGMFKTLPTNFVGASGSAGVAAAIASLASAGSSVVAYLSPDYTNTFLAPSSAQALANALPVASLRNGTVDVIPTAANASTALASFAPPAKQAAAAVPANWVPNAAAPTTGYPISGTSQIIVSQCYANANSTSPSPAQAIVDFLNDHFTNASFTSIVTGNGFNTVPSNYLTAIQADFLSNTSNFNLDIGDTSVCTGTITGR